MYAAKTGARINPQAGTGNKHINPGRLCSVCLFPMKMLAGTIQLSIGAKKKLGIGIN